MANAVQRLKIAALAEVDPRTVARYLAGKPVRGALLIARLERACAELGIAAPTANAETPA